MAELLQLHGLNGTFFIPIKNREGAPVMSPAQIRELGQQFEIGSHTYDHCFLSRVNFPQAHFQVSMGKEILQDVLGRKVAGFCYPGGKYRKEHTSLVKCAGFEYARTTMNLCFDAGDNRFEIPTTCQFYPHKRSVYLRNFASGRCWSKRYAGLSVVLAKGDWINRMTGLLDHACEHEAVFHLWVHSIDVDRLDAWRDLDKFLGTVASRIAPSNRISNQQLATRQFFEPIRQSGTQKIQQKR